jgi:hypothetical protein
MSVAILGAGPSGLMAALAAYEQGETPTIFSRLEKSKVFGAMFLHRSLPWITNNIPDFLVDVIKVGTAEGYATNVYGDPSHPVSWHKFEDGQVPAWDLRAAYDKLWTLCQRNIVETEIDIPKIGDILKDFEHVFSTLPLQTLCYRPQRHTFDFQRIWVQTMYDGLLEGINDANMIYYNGNLPPVGPKWYRYSQINKYRAWEYSSPPLRDERFALVLGRKPLGTNCTCFPGMTRIGRFGKWEKQVLTHHCFEEVSDALLQVRAKGKARRRNRH